MVLQCDPNQAGLWEGIFWVVSLKDDSVLLWLLGIYVLGVTSPCAVIRYHGRLDGAFRKKKDEDLLSWHDCAWEDQIWGQTYRQCASAVWRTRGHCVRPGTVNNQCVVQLSSLILKTRKKAVPAMKSHSWTNYWRVVWKSRPSKW
jgi:hypothetical protein